MSLNDSDPCKVQSNTTDQGSSSYNEHSVHLPYFVTDAHEHEDNCR